jgi:hypothetical protein
MQETFWDAVSLLKAWIATYGIPRALYTDWKTLYHSPRPQQPIEATQFGRLCARLGIKLIAASSPQAKGRVERSHGTNQDRLVKKLRLKNISTHTEANEYLEKIYLPEHNARFARRAASGTDYHVPILRSQQGADIWCLEYNRRVSLDGVISFNSKLLLLKLRPEMPVKARVMVRSSESGELSVFYRTPGGTEHLLSWAEHQPAERLIDVSRKRPSWTEASRPKANHPWRLKNSMDVAEALAAKAALLTPHRG